MLLLILMVLVLVLVLALVLVLINERKRMVDIIVVGCGMRRSASVDERMLIHEKVTWKNRLGKTAEQTDVPMNKLDFLWGKKKR